MTIVDLRNRLTAIIEDNEKHGWGERNLSNMVISIKTSKRITEYRAVKYAPSWWLGLKDTNVFELMTEDEPIWRNGNRKIRDDAQ